MDRPVADVTAADDAEPHADAAADPTPRASTDTAPTGIAATDAAATGAASSVVDAASADGHWWDDLRPLWPLTRVLLLVALSAALWYGCLRLFVLHNDFPSYYHPDERSKGEQLLSGERNFNHPLLMLETARLLQTPAGGEADAVDGTVRRARVVSAGYAAGAAALLALAGFAAAGWAGFFCVGATVGLCPALLSHAHYFKEDVTLVFGVAAVLCAGAWALRVRSPGATVWTLMALGVAAGVAGAGKYTGAVMLLPAVVIGTAAAWRHRAIMAAAPLVVAVFAVATWLAIDYRAVLDWPGFVNGFEGEKAHATTEHFGLALARPGLFFAGLVWTEAMPHVKALAVVAVPAALWQAWRRRRWAFAVALAATAGVYLRLLSYDAIPFYRYALPLTVMFYAFAGLGAAYAVLALPRARWRGGGAAVTVAVVVVLQGLRCADYTTQFADDSRDAVRAWAAAHLPRGTVVAVDGYVPLPDASDGWAGPADNDLRVLRSGMVADIRRTDDPQDLAALGVGYVITASSNRDRLFSPYVGGYAGRERGFERRVAFYNALSRLPVVWSRVAAHPMWTFTNPDIYVYRLDPPSAAARQVRARRPPPRTFWDGVRTLLPGA